MEQNAIIQAHIGVKLNSQALSVDLQATGYFFDCHTVFEHFDEV
jgi:hypothetical protein